ncbi:MAG TPA: DnaJ domain-containing protein [Hyphomicrobiaceae bacterium]|nr:DnaJ domain-containing protein [Hyphomicrobiaceae bacterium]
MSDLAAMRVALDLLHAPARVHTARTQPLPEGVHLLLRIAAGDEEAEREAAESTGRPSRVLRQAAGFYIEQILFSAESDAYRVLGSTPFASPADLRRNLAYLLKWVHPDLEENRNRSAFLKRVTAAWEEVKTPHRRKAYDAALIAAAAQMPAPYADDPRRSSWPSSPSRAHRDKQPLFNRVVDFARTILVRNR